MSLTEAQRHGEQGKERVARRERLRGIGEERRGKRREKERRREGEKERSQ